MIRRKPTFRVKPATAVIGIALVTLALFMAQHWLIPGVERTLVERDVTQATSDITAALGKPNEDNGWIGTTFCTNEVIDEAPYYYDLHVTKKKPAHIWDSLKTNCISATKTDLHTFDKAERTTLNNHATAMEASLQKDGWIGGGWLKSLAYNAVNWPSTTAAGGIYRKEVFGGTCWFDFGSSYDTFSDETVMISHVWCDQGHTTFTY